MRAGRPAEAVFNTGMQTRAPRRRYARSRLRSWRLCAQSYYSLGVTSAAGEWADVTARVPGPNWNRAITRPVRPAHGPVSSHRMIRPANPDPGPSGDPTPSRVGHACSAHLRIGEAGDQEHRCRVAAANRVMATPLSCIRTRANQAGAAVLDRPCFAFGAIAVITSCRWRVQ